MLKSDRSAEWCDAEMGFPLDWRDENVPAISSLLHVAMARVATAYVSFKFRQLVLLLLFRPLFPCRHGKFPLDAPKIMHALLSLMRVCSIFCSYNV